MSKTYQCYLFSIQNLSSRGLVRTYIEQAQDSGKLAMPAGSLKKNRINRWGLMAKIWARRKQCEFQC